MSRLSLFLVFPLVLALAANAEAQGRYNRQGFTLGAGVGRGSAGVSCPECLTDRETSPAFYIRAGRAVRPGFVLGAELEGWSKEEEGDRLTFAYISPVAQWYPVVENGFFLKGGVGLGSVHGSGDGFSLRIDAPAFNGGLGYDIAIGPSLSITPYVQYARAMKGAMRVDGVKLGEKAGTNLFNVGLGFTWH